LTTRKRRQSNIFTEPLYRVVSYHPTTLTGVTVLPRKEQGKYRAGCSPAPYVLFRWSGPATKLHGNMSFALLFSVIRERRAHTIEAIASRLSSCYTESTRDSYVAARGIDKASMSSSRASWEFPPMPITAVLLLASIQGSPTRLHCLHARVN